MLTRHLCVADMMLIILFEFLISSSEQPHKVCIPLQFPFFFFFINKDSKYQRRLVTYPWISIWTQVFWNLKPILSIINYLLIFIEQPCSMSQELWKHHDPSVEMEWYGGSKTMCLLVQMWACMQCNLQTDSKITHQQPICSEWCQPALL